MRKSVLRGSVAIWAFGAFVSVAHAQAAPPSEANAEELQAAEPSAPGDIVVTARRRNESAQTVPISIAALNGSQLADAGVTTGKDLGRVVAGLNWKGASNASRNNVFIRGVGSNNVGFASSPAVATYQDDIYLNAQPLQGSAAFDIDRVEVLKGPQGTLYGRNTTGGAIKFVSRKPVAGGDLTANLEFEGGNYEYIKATGGFGGGLGENAGFRFGYLIEHRDGLYKDYLVGDRLNSKSTQAARLQFLVKPTDRLSISLMGAYSRSSSDNIRYKRIDYVDPNSISFGPFGPTYSANCANPLVGTGPGCTNLAVAFGLDNPDLNRNPFQVQSGLRPGQSPEKVETMGLGATIDYDLGGATLTSVTSYYKANVDDTQEVDGSAANLLSIQDTAKPRQFAQEVRLASDGSGDLRWVLGAFYFRERLNASAPVTITAFGLGLGAVYKQITESKAAFAEGTYKITPDLELTVGLRYSHDRKKMDFTYFTYNPDNRLTTNYNQVVNELGITGGFTLNGQKQADNSISGRVNLSYKITPDIMIYASANRGFKGAEFNIGADRPETAIFVKPETVDAFEVGLKSDLFDRRLRVNLAGYYYNYKDKQEALFDGGVATLANAKARVWGIDAEVTLRPVDGLTLSAVGSYLNAKYKDFPSCKPDGTDCDGATLPSSPKLSAQLSGGYEFDIGSHTIGIHGSASYRSRTYYSPINVSYLSQEGYWLFDSHVSLGLAENVEVSAWIRNLTNKKYFADAFDVSSVGYSLVLPGQPRTFGVGLKADF